MRPVHLLPLVLLLAACTKPPPGGDSNPLELRTYNVPKGTARGLESVVKDVFYAGDKATPLGRASITPDGRLAVVAPHTMQAGVQTLVDEISKNPPMLEPTIELHYWLVVATPASTASPPPAGTKEIEPALAEIQRVSGPQTWSGLQKVSLATLSDETGHIEAQNMKIEQQAAQTGDGVYASIRVDLVANPGRLSTKVHLKPEQVLVLAATPPAGADAGAGSTLYYLVRTAPRPDGRLP